MLYNNGSFFIIDNTKLYEWTFCDENNISLIGTSNDLCQEVCRDFNCLVCEG